MKKDDTVSGLPPNMPPQYLLTAQNLARDVAGAADEMRAYHDASKQVSVSMPLRLLAQVEVLARRRGQSRGSMISTLVSLGAGITFEQLPPEVVAQIGEEVSNRETELYNDFDPQDGA